MGGLIPADWPSALMTGTGFALPFLVVKLLWNAIQWALTFKTAREDKREDRIDAGTQRLLEGLKEEVDRLSEECTSLRTRMNEEGADLRKRLSATEEELAECRRRHADAEARVKRLEAIDQGYGDAKQLAQLQASADAANKRKPKE